MAIEYIAYNESGERVTGILEIDSIQRAQEALWASNLVVLRLAKRREALSLSKLMPTFFGVKSKDIVIFTRELVSLLESGIGLVPALRILHEKEGKPSLREVIRSLLQDVEAGLAFSEACARQPSIFPSFYIRLIQVAEQTGELRKILLEILAYMERQAAIVGKIKKTLVYPAFVLTVGVVAATILITVALPALTGLLKEYSAELPLATRLLVAVGDISRDYGRYILTAGIVLTVLGWQYFRTPGGRKRWDAIILKTPVVGRVVYLNQMARLCSSLATMLSGGVPSAEAIQLSIAATDNSVFRNALTQVHREVVSGSRFESAILKQGIFQRLFSQSVGIGEETGNLKVNLRGLATFYEQETEKVAAGATAMLEPVIILVVGLFIAFFAIAVFSSIYSLIPQIH
ncbi:MAG: type II secretion system F family protein [Dehalococcoidia bacterium]|nr:type II secretion system F family protein [Dehalococcoidia bacterium]